ncbi:hypothetical protein BHE74_00021416 [Ensete ventricosum]|nr:hypothetical protein GW17_00015601 [Ensete ventricosum]RWW70884.1 hypothetical protein BHE74_00021416 [Ensete ventricosum]
MTVLCGLIVATTWGSAVGHVDLIGNTRGVIVSFVWTTVRSLCAIAPDLSSPLCMPCPALPTLYTTTPDLIGILCVVAPGLLGVAIPDLNSPLHHRTWP